MAQWFGVLAILVQDQSSVPCRVAPNSCNFSSSDSYCKLDSSGLFRHQACTWYIDTHANKALITPKLKQNNHNKKLPKILTQLIAVTKCLTEIT